MRGCDPDDWCPWWPMDWHTGPGEQSLTLLDGPVSYLLSRKDMEHIGDAMPVSRPAGFVRHA